MPVWPEELPQWRTLGATTDEPVWLQDEQFYIDMNEPPDSVMHCFQSVRLWHCDQCDVTWHANEGTPCWDCYQAGHDWESDCDPAPAGFVGSEPDRSRCRDRGRRARSGELADPPGHRKTPASCGSEAITFQVTTMMDTETAERLERIIQNPLLTD